MHKDLHNELMNENWIFQFLISSKYRILRHLLLIIFISAVLYNSTPEIPEPTLVLLLFFLLFYSNIYVLVPKLLFKNKYVWYFFTIISVLGVVIILTKIFLTYYEGEKFDDEGLNIPLFSILILILILILIAASTSIKLFQ